MSLFQPFNRRLHSGAFSTWKVECDALDEGDWQTLACMISERIISFGSVEGVPRGGLPLAHHLRHYITPGGPLLIVDDVLTTGSSLEEHRAGRLHTIGFVIFARGPRPSWVRALWTLDAD